MLENVISPFDVQFGGAFIIADNLYERNMIRLLWIDYCAAKYESDLKKKCVECLEELEGLIMKRHTGDFNLELPNLDKNNFDFVNLELVKNTRIHLQRKISLNNVRVLNIQNKFDELIEILKDSLVNSIEVKKKIVICDMVRKMFEICN